MATVNEDPTEREAKLPQWAQAQLRELRSQVAELRRTVKERDGEFGIDSDTGVVLYGRPHRIECLPVGSTIGFNLGTPGDRDGIVEVHAERKPNGLLQITTMHDALRVQPTASNVIGVWVGPWLG